MLINISHKIKMLHYHLAIRGPELLKGTISGNGMKAYWFRETVNFGDMITPLLLRHYGFTPIHTMPRGAQLVATGSILEHLPANYNGCILGSGFIEDASQMDFPSACVLAVRGKLTRMRLGGRHRESALGDPGLLASVVSADRDVKKFKLGFVPHHTEVCPPAIVRICNRYSSEVSLIDVRQEPLAVFRLIDQCEHILSSSLHGLIVADSFGIPSGWLSAHGLVGGRFKFDDYYSSLDVSAGSPHIISGDETMNELLALTSLKPKSRIEELQDTLGGLWSNLGQYCR